MQSESSVIVLIITRLSVCTDVKLESFPRKFWHGRDKAASRVLEYSTFAHAASNVHRSTLQAKVRLRGHIMNNGGGTYSALHELLRFQELGVQPRCIIEINGEALWEAICDSPEEKLA